MNNINCYDRAKEYLVEKHLLYMFRGPIALLIAIFAYAYAKQINFSNNSYVNQILVPIGTFAVIVLILDMLTKNLINDIDVDKLAKICKLWLNDPNISNNPMYRTYDGLQILDVNAAYNYSGRIEGFKQNNNTQCNEKFSVNSAAKKDTGLHTDEDGIEDKIPTNFEKVHKNFELHNQVYSVTPVGDSLLKNTTPIGATYENQESNSPCLINSNACGTLCSGTGINSCNVVAPVPGPQWQPQSASTVQSRLVHGKYVPSICNQGGTGLRTTPNCLNSGNGPKHVVCNNIPIHNM